MDKDDMLVVFFGALGVLLISGLVVFSVIEAEEEDAARDCHVVSYEEHGYRDHARTGYLCNDGITYYRVTE